VSWWDHDILPLAANEVLLALEELVQNLDDANGLLLVALLGGRNVLRVERVEPTGLAKVWALAILLADLISS
jgi:hypothetical protein